MIDTIRYFFRRKFWQIKNLFRWIPIIWNQFDFDYRYSIDVFKFQLQKQADFLESDKAHTVEAENNAKRIRMVLRLMDKVYDEEYGCEYQGKLKEKYGEDVLDWHFIDIEDKPGYSTMKWNYEVDEKYESLRDQIEADKDRLFKESQEKQHRAHKLLWALIEHNIRGWWD